MRQLQKKLSEKLYRLLFLGPENDSEFLPGALEVTENPPSPIGRSIIWLIVAFLIGSVLWATLSQTEVVAVAQGKLVPVGEVKVIQPLEPGIIHEITVAEGQHVNKGQVLLYLDPTTSQADAESLKQRLQHLRNEITLFSALLSWDHNNSSVIPIVKILSDTSHTEQQLYKERLLQEITVVINTLAGHASDFKRLVAQENRVRINVEKYNKILKIDEEVANTFLSLYKKKVSSRHQWLAAEQTRIKNEQDRNQLIEQIEEIEASRVKINQDMALVISTFRSNILQKMAQAESEVVSIEQEISKADMRNSLKELTSPVSGYVHQLSVHTLGGVVQSGDTLMVIVPERTELHLKANIMNRDVGFIHVGQRAQIKLDAFPFTEFGMIDGEVMTISADAIQQQDNPDLLFPCTIKLKDNNIISNGKPVELRPGMVSTGEIVIRKRRLISYFLSPLLKHTQESLRER